MFQVFNPYSDIRPEIPAEIRQRVTSEINPKITTGMSIGVEKSLDDLINERIP